MQMYFAQEQIAIWWKDLALEELKNVVINYLFFKTEWGDKRVPY